MTGDATVVFDAALSDVAASEASAVETVTTTSIEAVDRISARGNWRNKDSQPQFLFELPITCTKKNALKSLNTALSNNSH